jgi:molybdate transport system substrate-binding protein
MKRLYTFLLVVCLACALRAYSQELTVAAAADLRPALEQIAAKFQAASGVALLVSYGSSGKFARGSIVVMVPANSRLDLKAGLRVLLDPAVKKIAIADPAHAPYGQAAVAALKSQGLYDQVSPKLVTGENISQAASFVLSGAADAGIVAKSLALAPLAREKTKFVPVPDADYPPIQQAMVVIKASKNQPAAMKFVSYMQANDAKKILMQYGFEVPGN